MRRIPFPGERAPHHQFMLGMALLALEAESEAKAMRRTAADAKTPRKWRKIHANVNRAWAALDRIG